MDRARWAVNNLIPQLDDATFEIYAGLYNARSLGAPMLPVAEAELLRYVLRREFERLGDPELLHLEQLLDQYLM